MRPNTVNDIRQAIADLDRQASQLRLNGRVFMIDIVMQTPDRFLPAVKTALEPRTAVAAARGRPVPVRLPREGPSRARSPRSWTRSPGGAHAGDPQAPEAPEVNAAVLRLSEAGIPVVTLVTDLPFSKRLAYVGMDNRSAGATAAYLVNQWLGEFSGFPGRDSRILVALSRTVFRGEEEREIGFGPRSASAGRTAP